MSPRHSIDFCPICGGGLCGLRIYGIGENSPANTPPHGLVICDECEAIWLEPDTSTVHVYPDLENPVSPVSGEPLWGETSRWATIEDIKQLGWLDAVNRDLDVGGEEKIV
ncbi:hypothetical protein N9N28_04035 [Rubripirellula amarantea]|uniref:Uncharacterized protein n=1 Tax=Rubripirellula amarantea TaxID=2527999 RepID=A0A5C5WXV1_9BACT|nr:hypothetical protein [Rubripirellula amarantea]MDA8743786.1 hypothetical protein [Rubripirellula amarantea]TWT54702.1 hypothetical protein Pla22_23530 [Rubripirellula amarantea]